MADNQGRVNVINNETGAIESVPQSQLNDALQMDYRVASTDEVNSHFQKQEFTSGAKPFLAGLAGAARGATLGLSDIAMTKTGLVQPDTLKNLEQYNPVESLTGEVGAVGATLLLPGYGEAAGVSAAARTAARAAQVVTSPARVATRLGQAGEAFVTGERAASALGRVGQKALQTGTAGAIEGGLYGAGRALTEHAMGDPELNGEKIFSHISMGALLGGGLGALFGGALAGTAETHRAIKSALGEGGGGVGSLGIKDLEATANKLTPQEMEAKTLADAAGISKLPEKEQLAFFEEAAKRKPDASDIEAAAMMLRGADGTPAPVTEAMLTNSEHVQRISQATQNSGSLFGQRLQNMYNKGWDIVSSTVDNVLGAGTGESLNVFGERMRGQVRKLIEDPREVFTSRYAARDEFTRGISISDDMRLSWFDSLKDKLRNTNDGRRHGNAEAVVKDLNDIFLPQSSLSDLEVAIKDLKAEARSLKMTNPSRAKTYQVAASEFEKNIDNELLRRARELERSGIPEQVASAKQVISEYDLLKADYKANAEMRDRLAKTLKLGKRTTPEQLLNALENKNPKDLIRVLFNKDNIKSIEFIKQVAPEVYNDMLQWQRRAIRDNATDATSKVFNPKTALREINELEPEIRSAIFNPGEESMVKASSKYLSAYPKNFNPSGTAGMAQYAGLFSVDGILRNIKDAGAIAYLKSLNLKSDDAMAAAALNGMVDRSAIKIRSGVSNIFKTAEAGATKVSGYAGAKVGDQLIDHEKQKKAVNNILNLKANPDEMLAYLEKIAKPLYNVAPETAQSVQQAAVRAMDYVVSASPMLMPKAPLDPEMEPSKIEIGIMAERLHTIQKPTSVLNEIKKGTLTPAHVEALDAIYPKMLQTMREEVISGLVDMKAKKKSINNTTKNMLSLFLGMDLDSSITAQAIMQNQQAHAASRQANQQQAQQMAGAVRPTQKGLGELKQSSQAMMPMQKSALRMT
jgi:hypothetical protein